MLRVWKIKDKRIREEALDVKLNKLSQRKRLVLSDIIFVEINKSDVIYKCTYLTSLSQLIVFHNDFEALLLHDHILSFNINGMVAFIQVFSA